MSGIFKNGIIEDVDTVKHIPIGHFWGITVSITPLTWLSPFIFFGLHLLLRLINGQYTVSERLFQAVIFTIAVEIGILLHSFGHILSGKIVGSAMDELLITSTRDVNLYHGDQSLVPGYVHLVRSLGGPIFSLLSAAACYAVGTVVSAGVWSALLTSLISVNLFLGLGSLLPIPSVDGEVIWREIARSIRTKRE